jgi:plasmid replication initiation protein
MDQRKTNQLTLPFDVPKREFKNHVKQHWNITFARQGQISVYAKRIMALVMAQIRENDHKLKKYYQIHASDIIEAADLKGKSPYSVCKKALDELAAQIWRFEDLEKEIYRPKHLINTSTIEKKDGFEYGYVDGLITVVLNPFLEPYLVELSHYTKYQLENYMKFESWYSMRLWEILSSFRDQGWWYVTIEEYRKLTDCENKYPKVFDLIKKTLAEPTEEFKGTQFEFEVDQIKAQTPGKGRKPVVALEFRFKTEMKTIPPSWYKTSRKHDFVLRELVQKYKVEEINIIKYGRFIGLEGLAQLRYQFEIKQLSSKKINDFAKYCNKVLIEAGEKAKKEVK